MSNGLVNLDMRDDRVALITLNNPKVNALSKGVLDDLQEIAHELHATRPGAVVITGGERIFAAGADISEFGGPVEAKRVADTIHRAFDKVAAIPAFVIAAISGYALGGGCELALACDYRIGSTKAVLGQPEILLGIIPGGGGTQRLPRLVGASRAKEIMVTGRQVKSDEALRIGLLDEVVEPEALHERAFALAAEIAAGATVASALIKQAVDTGLNMPLAGGLAGEKDLFVEVFKTNDSQRGVKSFLENGPGKAAFEGN
ncbi:MAG: enoyl-CoA hydratase/isomerase family protein [Acidobacteria bacterium]|nr:enoyl-CoA hydratase/isomerase family protein [Acidobacteriota bacterium]